MTFIGVGWRTYFLLGLWKESVSALLSVTVKQEKDGVKIQQTNYFKQGLQEI